jgi:hypothetical protein
MLRFFPIIFVAILLSAMIGCDSVGVTSNEYYQQRLDAASNHNMQESIRHAGGGSAPNFVPLPVN